MQKMRLRLMTMMGKMICGWMDIVYMKHEAFLFQGVSRKHNKPSTAPGQGHPSVGVCWSGSNKLR